MEALPPSAAHPHLEHSSGQDDATLAGDGLLALQQVVDEQRDGGKAVTLQPVQVLQGGKAAGSPLCAHVVERVRGGLHTCCVPPRGVHA